MRIWLVKTGEPIPLGSNDKARLHRTGLMARIFGAAGHEVTWFTSTFDRVERRNLFTQNRTITPFPGVTVKLLHSPGYKRSLSFARLRDQHIMSKGLIGAMEEDAGARPDIILCAYPTVELSKASIAFGLGHGIPVVLDMRDMWPDIIVDSAPKLLKPLVAMLLRPMSRDARIACASATAIIGITDAFVQWGLDRGGRCKTDLDRAFPLAHLNECPPTERMIEAGQFWDSLGIVEDSHDFRAIFLGTLGHQFDVNTLLEAANHPEIIKRRIRFIICGDGDRFAEYREMAARSPNVVFPGWVDMAQAHVLLRRCNVGLDPLPDRYDFLATINNKAIEYLSAGLPVISSPRAGVLYDLLKTHACGMSYSAGDVNALALVLIELASAPKVVAQLSANASRLFKDRFQAEKVYTELGVHLEKVVRAARPMRKSKLE